METRDFNYIIFVLGRDLLKGILPYENDLAFELCEEIANNFSQSKYNVDTKGLYECLEEYIKDNKELLINDLENFVEYKERQAELMNEWAYVLQNNLNYNNKEDRINAKSIIDLIDKAETMSLDEIKKQLKEFQ